MNSSVVSLWRMGFGLVLGLSFLATVGQANPFLESLARVPVQDNGRIKPLDTLARESLQLVWGRQTYNGRSALEVAMTWILVPDHWDEQEFVRVEVASLKEALKLPKEKSLYSPRELMNNDRIGLLFTDLQGKRQNKEKLNGLDQAVQTLESQLGVYHLWRKGQAVRAWPTSDQDLKWASWSEGTPEASEAAQGILMEFLRHTKGESVTAAPVEKWLSLAGAQGSALFPTEAAMAREIHYHRLAPFQKAWILLVVALALLALELVIGKKLLYWGAWATSTLALALLVYGFYLRIAIAGRPPVSNMYESVIWVASGALVFGMLFEWLQQRRFMLAGGGAVAALSLIVADLGAAVLDPSLQPLQAVLNSNFWLIVHVLTITLSYAAFFLAFALGDMGLICVLRGSAKDRVDELALGAYRAIQVGVVLLAAGTILGGVWADKSWGRFWGWDPKETWAFIALMGYLALLHARLIGWVRSVGFLAGSVVAFSLVLMAWYGVNYVLGAGLHSYGFGAGGVQYVALFVAVHLVLVSYVVASTRTQASSQ